MSLPPTQDGRVIALLLLRDSMVKVVEAAGDLISAIEGHLDVPLEVLFPSEVAALEEAMAQSQSILALTPPPDDED